MKGRLTRRLMEFSRSWTRSPCRFPKQRVTSRNALSIPASYGNSSKTALSTAFIGEALFGRTCRPYTGNLASWTDMLEFRTSMNNNAAHADHIVVHLIDGT